MSQRPRLSQLDLWATKESECLEVIRAAVGALAKEPGNDPDEDVLNRRLMRFIDSVLAARSRAGGSSLQPPAYEGRSSPAPSDPLRASREFKRPDFTWLWIDDLAPNPRLSRREFAVECKRLTPGQRLRLYVTNGICRFQNTTHAYGKDMRSGAMVGYLQSIEMTPARTGVNNAAHAEGIAALDVLHQAEETSGVLAHQLARSYPVTPFALTHVWETVVAG